MREAAVHGFVKTHAYVHVHVLPRRRTYRPFWVISDFVAGMSVGCMTIPQG